MADSPSYVPQTSETNPVKQNVAIQQLYTSVADAASAADALKTDFISGIIRPPANQDYRIVERLPYAVTFTRLTAKCASGSLTMTVKVNATTIGNFSQAVGAGQVTTTSAAPNTAVLADVIVVTISAVAGAVDLSFTLEFTRTLS